MSERVLFLAANPLADAYWLMRQFKKRAEGERGPSLHGDTNRLRSQQAVKMLEAALRLGQHAEIP